MPVAQSRPRAADKDHSSSPRGKAFIVSTPGWLRLPTAVRSAAIKAFNANWTWGGVSLVRAQECMPRALPRQLDLTDVVVRCYPDSVKAASELKRLVSAQLAQVVDRHGVKSLEKARTAMSAASFTVAQGRASTVKCKQRAESKEVVICVTESVVALQEAFGMWVIGLSLARVPIDPRITFASIAKAPTWIHTQFGASLGRLMAHEARHQLAHSDDPLFGGLGGAMDGLGEEGCSFWRGLTFTSADRSVIEVSMRALSREQRGLRTAAVNRA